MKLLKELIIEENSTDDAINLMEAMSLSVKELNLIKKGKVLSDRELKKFMKSKNKLVTAAAIDALAKYAQMKTNRRNILKLFARTPYEKKMVKQIVDELIKTKLYKLYRKRYAEGGMYYELKRNKSGF